MKTTRFWATLGLIVGAGAVVILAGCNGTRGGTRASARHAMGLAQGTDPEALRADLGNFVDLYSAVIAGAMGEVAAQTRDRQAREYAFLVRARQIPRARAALLDDDPREAFVRIWAQVAYNRYWSSRGNFGLIFHEFAPMLDAASITLEDAILQLALRHFPEENVQETRERLESTIRSLPPGSDLSPPSEIIAMAGASSANPLSILLVPLRPFTGVNDAADSIAELAQVGQSALQFLKELPLMMRWQAEMLLFAMDDMETMTTLRERSTELSAQLGALSAVAEALPERIRAETEILLKTADDSNRRLGQTLIETQRATEQINAALVQAERVSGSLLTTSNAFTGTMDSARGLIGDLERLRGPQTAENAVLSPINLPELNRLADSLERTVSETRALLIDTAQPLAPESGVNQTIDRASIELNRLLNGVLWRGAALIGLAFLAALVFHGITRAGTRKAAQPGRT